MTNIILSLFKKETLWRFLFKREGFRQPTESLEAAHIWTEVFYKNPELKDWMRKREFQLLQSLVISDKEKQFILGQIAEAKLYQRFDVKGEPSTKKVLEEFKMPDMPAKLESWRKVEENKEENGNAKTRNT